VKKVLPEPAADTRKEIKFGASNQKNKEGLSP
jgi:hypothetical protein